MCGTKVQVKTEMPWMFKSLEIYESKIRSSDRFIELMERYGGLLRASNNFL